MQSNLSLWTRYHLHKTASSLSLWPATGSGSGEVAAPVCMCERPAAPFGQAVGNIKYLPTGEEFGFVNGCRPEPAESVLVRQLRPHLGRHLTHASALHHPACAARHTLLGDHADGMNGMDGMVIGACNPMLYPIRDGISRMHRPRTSAPHHPACAARHTLLGDHADEMDGMVIGDCNPMLYPIRVLRPTATRPATSGRTQAGCRYAPRPRPCCPSLPD